MYVIVPAILLFSFVYLLFDEVRYADFLHWDDDGYIEKNNLITNLHPSNIGKMFSTFYFANWHPVTWLSHAIDIQIFGYHPAGHHLVNLVLHGINSVLVFILTLLIVNITSRRDNANYSLLKPNIIKITIIFLTSLWFAIHPLRIESFAWVSQRKDVLCTFFFLFSTILYLLRFRTTKHGKALYLGSLTMFSFAIMSKGTAVTLPIVYFLIDIIPGVRAGINVLHWREMIKSKAFHNVILEKIPFLLFSAICGILIVLAQQDAGAIKSVDAVAFHVRLLNSVNSIFVYVSKTILPLHLLPIYPYPAHVYYFNLTSIFQLIVLFAVIIVACYKFHKGSPQYLIIFTIYFVLLLPVIGLLQVGEQPFADRYSYLPTIPLFIALAVLLNKHFAYSNWSLAKSKTTIVLPYVLLIAMISFASLQSSKYIKVWRNDFTLWSYVLNTSAKPAVIAYNNLGARYKDEGQLVMAENILLSGLEKYTDNPAIYNNLKTLYQTTKQYSKAIELIDNLSVKNGVSARYISDKSHFLIQQNLCADALEILSAAIIQYGNNAKLKYQTAYCLSNQNKFTQALALLNQITSDSLMGNSALMLKNEIMMKLK